MGRWTGPIENILTGNEVELWDRYPRYVVQAFFAVSYEDYLPNFSGIPSWPRDEHVVAAEAIEAFVQGWGGISDEIFMHVLNHAQGRDRLVALFALGFGPLPQAIDLLVPWLESADLLERCASAIVLGLRRDERALPVLEEYLLADNPSVEITLPGSSVPIRCTQPGSHPWFSLYRPWVVGVFATWGPTSMLGVLRNAFLKYWAQEQEDRHPTYRLPDGFLYVLGRRGALAVLHGLALPELHRRLTMIILALGAVRADERFDDLYRQILVDRELKQEVASICTTHFGIAEQEVQQYIKLFSSDRETRRVANRQQLPGPEQASVNKSS